MLGMIARRCASAVLALAGLSATAVAARADYLLASRDGGGAIYQVDVATGAAVKVGDGGANLDGPEDLVIDGNGDLIAVSFVPGINTVNSFKTTFSRLDPTTFAPTVLATASDYRFFEGLANVDGVLYGSASTLSSYGADTADTLVRIDLAAGTFTKVGMFGPEFLNVEDIAYSPTLGLYGVDIGTLDPATGFRTFNTTPALIKISLADGTATKVADLPPSMVELVPNPNNNILSPRGPFLAGLDFGPDGQLYAVTLETHFGGPSRLMKIDPLTGAITDVGPTGVDGLDGLVYVRTVPEPGGLALALIGVATIATARRTRRRSARGR